MDKLLIVKKSDHEGINHVVAIADNLKSASDYIGKIPQVERDQYNTVPMHAEKTITTSPRKR